MEEVAAPGDGWRDTVRFLWAAGLVIAYILGSYLVDNWVDHTMVLAFDAGFLILVIVVAFAFNRALGNGLRPRATTPARILTYIGLQAALSALVFFTIPWISRVFELEDLSYTAIFLWSDHPLLFSLLSIAVMPALTEELAFRGILFGQLQRLTTVNSAIIVTGLLFAFVHFSMLGMYWLFPAGLLYGWIRAREGHIWWGVLLHMTHNAVVVIQELGWASSIWERP